MNMTRRRGDAGTRRWGGGETWERAGLFQVKCEYLEVEKGRELYGISNQVISGFVRMINHPKLWAIGK